MVLYQWGRVADPDPHYNENLDPELHLSDADPQSCNEESHNLTQKIQKSILNKFITSTWGKINSTKVLAILCLYRLHTAILHWPLSSAATMEVQGPDTTWRRIQGLLLLAYWWWVGAICTFCSSSQNQVTGKTSVDPFPPPSNQPGLSPPPSPLGYLLHHLQRWTRGRPRQKSHFSLWFVVGGRRMG